MIDHTNNLIIGDREREAAKKIMVDARKNFVPLDEVMRIHVRKVRAAEDMVDTVMLGDRKETRDIKYHSKNLMLGNFRAAFSYEQQPTGMVKHLSLSSPGARNGKIPDKLAIEAVCDLFEFTGFPPKGGNFWLEEYQPGEMAINVIELVEPN